jgi:hypothetical protein
MKTFILINAASGLDPATLVFKTIRKGFPNGDIRISFHPNNTEAQNDTIKWRISDITKEVFALVGDLDILWFYHWDWIERLIITEHEPFWICDTDIVFWDAAEKALPTYYEDASLIGEFIPRHLDVFTGAIMQGKLHTALMYINPTLFKSETVKFKNALGCPVRMIPEFINPQMVLLNKLWYYYDTLAMYYHGSPSCRRLINCSEVFTHLHAGTWVKAMAKTVPNFAERLELQHSAVYSNIKYAKSIRQHQNEYYKNQEMAADDLIKNYG